MDNLVKKPFAVHIGTGKLGLGFIGDILNECGFKLFFLNRHSSNDDSKKRYSLLKKNGNYKISFVDSLYTEEICRTIRIQKFAFLSKKSLTQIMCDPNVYLCTIAIGKVADHNSITPFLYEALKQRYKKRIETPFFILSCENDYDNIRVIKNGIINKSDANQALRDYIENKIGFISTIADRACSHFMPDSQNVCIETESYKSWYLGVFSVKSNLNVLKSLLKSNKDIIYVNTPEEFEVYERQKLWLVNGIHLAVAIYAYSDGINLLNEAIRLQKIKIKIQDLQAELTQALIDFAREKSVDPYFPRSKIEEFNENFLKRMTANKKDNCNRILPMLFSDKYITSLIAKIKDNKIISDTSLIAKIIKDNKIISDIGSVVKCIFETGFFYQKIIVRMLEPLQILERYNRSHLAITQFLDQLVRTQAALFEHYYNVITN